LKIATNPTGKTLIFEEADHSYIIKETGQRLTSSTQFVHKFFPEFDREFHSKRKAIDYGITQEEVLETWAKIRDTAATFGSSVHNFAERYVRSEKGIDIPDGNEKFRNYCIMVSDVLDWLKGVYTFVDAEKMLFSEKLGLSGTTDLLFRNKNTMLILDWKTSKEIQDKDIFKTWKDTMGLPSKAKPPIEHIEDCNFNHYSLQLNIYKRLLEEEKYYPDITDYKMYFIHFQDDLTKLHEVPDLSKDIDNMIKEKQDDR
jgi:ATP-dependent exoDNAse (exonuclease V) beta subunit